MGGRLGPARLTSIIGRDDEVSSIGAAFAAGSRLVTLTGLGGIGKTTIAEAYATRVTTGADHRPGYFVDLVPVGDPRGVLDAIAGAVGVAGADAGELEANVASTLRRTSTLLVLDNFEHVVGARDLVGRLIDAAGGGLQVLITSRIPIGVAGEQLLPVEPLSIPATTAELETCDASRLVLARARERSLRAAQVDEAGALVEICGRMDGIPLALELAAAWLSLLSPRAVVRRLDERRLRLAGSSDDRHATIDRVVETTLDLLGPDERRAFEDLSIFDGPFDEAGARAVAGIDDVLTVLRRLESIALLQARVDSEGEPRFRMLETVRTVGAARLAARSDVGDVEQRFVDQAATRAQAAADALRDLNPGGTLGWMTAEHPNLLGALAVATRRRDAPHAVQLAMTLATYGVRAGNARESLDRVLQALTIGPVPAEIRSEALCAVANLRSMVGDETGLIDAAREAVELARTVGDGRREARALIALGSYGPREDAESLLGAANDLATRIGYTWAALAARDNLASARAESGNWSGALELLERSAADAAEAGDVEGDGYALAGMADLMAKLGRAEAAYELAARAEALMKVAWPQGAMYAWSLGTLALCAALTGRTTDAFSALVEACTIAEAAESGAAMINTLEIAAQVLADDRPELAVRAIGFVAEREPDREPARSRNPIVANALAGARRSLGRAGFDRARAAGASADGRLLLNEVQAAAVALRRDAAAVTAEFGALTARETEVLRLLAAGRTDPEIAMELGMSPKTASVHVANIKGKLGAETRVDASIRARDLLASAGGRRAG